MGKSNGIMYIKHLSQFITHSAYSVKISFLCSLGKAIYIQQGQLHRIGSLCFQSSNKKQT